MTEKERLFSGQESATKNNNQSGSNSLPAQRQRLLNYLRNHGSITTIEARRELDVIHPAGRVLDLRKAGEPIDTVWVEDITEQGKPHRVAKYVLSVSGVGHGERRLPGV
jgi:hypothetical protein